MFYKLAEEYRKAEAKSTQLAIAAQEAEDARDKAFEACDRAKARCKDFIAKNPGAKQFAEFWRQLV